MNIDFYKPTNSLLELYMEGYYFISCYQNESLLKYYTYPNNFGILATMREASIQRTETEIIISKTPGTTFYCSYINRYTKPILIRYEHPVNEITIYFKPIGINHFMSDPTRLLQDAGCSLQLFSDYDSFITELFAINNRKEQIDLLEKYWLSKLNPNEKLLKLEHIIRDIENGDKIEMVACKYGISRQYLTKLFLTYLGKTPSEYRKIHRFRNTLASYKDTKNLTELSYHNLFYDQAHFNKDFKHFTNTKPGYFLSHVDIEKNMIWRHI